jgi:mersacidin/lichenicidin family type 2 lantibiotic
MLASEGEVMSQPSEAVMNQVRAWKDPAYRAALQESELASMKFPVAPVDLSDPWLSRLAR